MRIRVLTIFVFLFLITGSASAEETENFFIESSYDLNNKEQVEAFLKEKTGHAYFYIEKEWWDDLTEEEQEEYEEIVDNLGKEFENHIYPKISSFLGEMPKHSVVGEKDEVYILFHPMEEGSGGYFRTGDQYSVYQYSHSNKRNIVYLNANLLKDKNINGYLAHEYVHLVTFNEKNKKNQVSEEIWLNELRAEVIISILGYNEDYETSNLQERISAFLHDPDFSLTDWTNQAGDYGVINAFGHYLVDHYGKEVLSDSLKSDLVGIPSIDYALEEGEHEKIFSEIFNEWVVAVYLNDCSYGDYYCYKNEDLKEMRASHSNIFISPDKEDYFVLEYKTKNWAGNWHRIVGGEGTLNFTFYSDKKFTVPYLLCKKNEDCELEKIQLNGSKKENIIIEDFSSNYESITIIPFLGDKVVGFDGPGESSSFAWEAKIEGERQGEWAEVWERLAEIRERIENLYSILGLEVPKNR
jgi:hypothetical protein